MFRAHAITMSPPAGLPHFELHRTVLAEASADAAWGVAWVLLWLLFIVSVATPPALHRVGEAQRDAGAPGGSVTTDGSAQPGPGSSPRGVAPCTPTSAG